MKGFIEHVKCSAKLYVASKDNRLYVVCSNCGDTWSLSHDNTKLIPLLVNNDELELKEVE
jgi:hypothetical protein